jgi:hypothetical protein
MTPKIMSIVPQKPVAPTVYNDADGEDGDTRCSEMSGQRHNRK